MIQHSLKFMGCRQLHVDLCLNKKMKAVWGNGKK